MHSRKERGIKRNAWDCAKRFENGWNNADHAMHNKQIDNIYHLCGSVSLTMGDL